MRIKYNEKKERKVERKTWVQERERERKFGGRGFKSRSFGWNSLNEFV